MIRLTAVIELEGQAPRALTYESNARSITLGRDPGTDFQVPLSTVSRQHARIIESDGVYFIEDLGSTHGSVLNGKALPKGEKKILRDGDIIELTKAKITCSLQADKVAVSDPGEGTNVIAVKAVQGILGRLGEARDDGPFFRVITGADEGVRLPLSGSLSEWTIGRGKDCAFVLNDPNISRHHALVKKDWNGFTVQDLGSRNGVTVNDTRLRKPRRLRDKDEVYIGPVKLLFIDPDADLLASLKGVPGFDMADPIEEMGNEASIMGAPGATEESQPGSNNTSDGPDGQHQDQSQPTVSDGDEATELGDIDPELLANAKPRFPVEWIIIGVAGLLVVAAIVILFFALG